MAGDNKRRGPLSPRLLLLPILATWALVTTVVGHAMGLGERIPSEWVPPLPEVVSLHLKPAFPVPRDQAPRTLYAAHPEHLPVIAAILDLMSEAHLTLGEISPPVRGPSLQISLQNGNTTSIRPAFDCSPPAANTGQPYACRQSPDQVILLTRQGREVRVRHPNMVVWLSEGWRAQIPLGEAPDLDRELAIAIARDQSRLGGWRATFEAEYPVERLGETEVRRAWLLETDLSASHKIRMVLDAKTGEVLRVVQLEGLVGSTRPLPSWRQRQHQ